MSEHSEIEPDEPIEGPVEGDAAPDEPTEEELRRRDAALAEVVVFGDPVLRSKASEVREFGAELREEADHMIAIMRDAMGVGLAATQLGALRRLLVFQAGPDATPTALANPVIEWRSGDLATAAEGCLSLPRVDRRRRAATSRARLRSRHPGRADPDRGVGPRGARPPARDRPSGRRPHPGPDRARSAKGRDAGAARGHELHAVRARLRRGPKTQSPSPPTRPAESRCASPISAPRTSRQRC